MTDPKKVLFSKSIGRGDDSVSVHIECEQDVNVSLSVPHSVTVIESMNSGVPVVVATFTDAAGDLVNIQNLDTTVEYRMHIGTTQDTIVSDVPLRISSIEFGNTVSGQMKQVTYEVTFVHAAWDRFSYGIHSKGWSNVRFSDVVEELTSHMPSTITPTNGVETSIIQPNWTNSRMIRWIAERCVSAGQQHNNYVYGITIEGEFFFSPLSSLYDNLNESFVAGQDPVMYVGREKTHRNNKQGASGVHSDSYDFNTGNGGRTSLSYDDVISPSLTDWTLVDASLQPHIEINHGRDPHHREISLNRIAKLNDSYQTVKVMTYAATSMNVRIGQSVDVVLMSFDDMETNAAFSENYSGRYVVAGSRISLTESKKRRSILQIELTLIRQGINDSSKRNYIRGN